MHEERSADNECWQFALSIYTVHAQLKSAAAVIEIVPSAVLPHSVVLKTAQQYLLINEVIR